MSVILPGSYDPVTNGHLAIIKRAAELYDEVFVVAFINPSKTYTFTPQERVSMLMIATEGLDNVLVSYSDGMVVDYMREHGIDRIVKGYRNEADLAYEREMAEYNKSRGGYETELWLSDEENRTVSSTEARRRIAAGEDLSEILPLGVIEYIKALDKQV